MKEKVTQGYKNATSPESREAYIRIWRWLFFSVGIGLLPISFSFIYDSIYQIPFSLSESLSHGELVIVSIVLVGEVLRATREQRKAHISGKPDTTVPTSSKPDIVAPASSKPSSFIFYGSIGVLIGCCVMFAIIASHDARVSQDIQPAIDAFRHAKNVQDLVLHDNMRDLERDSGLDKDSVMWYSIGFFATTLVVSLRSKWLEKTK